LLRLPSPLPAETEDIVERVIGCGLEVHRQLGPGFLESIYQRALGLELHARGLSFAREVPIYVRYKHWSLPGQRVDLIVEDRVIVEVKAADRLARVHRAQVISYLKTTGLRVALVMNFKCRLFKDGLRRVIL